MLDQMSKCLTRDVQVFDQITKYLSAWVFKNHCYKRCQTQNRAKNDLFNITCI